jgi:hypothetical protein
MPEGKKFYGYFRAFPKGINSDVDPLLLPADQLAMATNATMRGTFVNERPRFQKQIIKYDSDATKAAFQSGWFQGATYYRSPQNGYIMCVVAGRLYAFSIGANGSILLSEIKQTSSIPNPNPSFPNPPLNLIATAGDSSVNLQWDIVDGAIQYTVKRSTASGSGYVSLGSLTNNLYTDSTAVNGTTYYYVVSATNSGGESANSAQVSASPISALTPGIPVMIAHNSVKSGSVGMAWDTQKAIASNCTSVIVYRSSSLNGTYSSIIELDVNCGVYIDTGRTNGVNNYYKLAGLNRTVEGSKSVGFAISSKTGNQVTSNSYPITGDYAGSYFHVIADEFYSDVTTGANEAGLWYPWPSSTTNYGGGTVQLFGLTCQLIRFYGGTFNSMPGNAVTATVTPV